MLTSSQRAYLRSIASSIDSLYQVGKNGITDNLVKTLSDALEARELIKVTALESCENTPRELVAMLAERLDAEPVQAIGRKMVLYRASRNKPPVIVLP